MKLLTYKKNTEVMPGILKEDGNIIPLSSLGMDFSDMNDLITRASAEDLAKMEEAAVHTEGCISAADVQILAPIPYPKQDVICLGLNYTEHAEEAYAYSSEAFDRKEQYPIYFSKRVNYAPGDGEGIPAYEDLVDRLDYEAELAVIIGKDAKNVSEREAEQYIFGYTICNDVSARNLQTRHAQWYFGKSLDGFTPMGPVITTAADIVFPPKLRISCTVNGELRQNSTTDMLIFGIPRIISELSQGMTLKAGTIISTGTPKGVGMGMTPPTFLKKGDVVTCEIEKIGSLTNTIV